jgi:hypothetical protein
VEQAGDPEVTIGKTGIESAFLLGILAARADLRGRSCKHRPTTIVAIDHGLSQHPSNHRAAAPAAARTGADAGALAHLLEGLSSSLDGFEHGAFADLVAQAGRFEVFDDRLRPGLLF